MSNLENKDILAQNLKRLMRIKNVDRNTMCDDLKLKYSTVSEWLSANKYPRIDKIELMANYFGVLKSDIIEQHISPKSEISILPQENIYQIPIFENVAAGWGN